MGSVLTWGPCYYHQKQFFSGSSISPRAELEYPDMQRAQGMTWDPQDTDSDSQSLLRYDLEVSGFPSSHSGHVILLGLTDQDYPGTKMIEDWPSWNLPVMRWGHAQNALVGYAHCGLGLSVGTDELPNHVIPGFQSIGSNEIIVDVPLGAADFQCGAEFAPAAVGSVHRRRRREERAGRERRVHRDRLLDAGCREGAEPCDVGARRDDVGAVEHLDELLLRVGNLDRGPVGDARVGDLLLRGAPPRRRPGPASDRPTNAIVPNAAVRARSPRPRPPRPSSAAGSRRLAVGAPAHPPSASNR